MAEVWIPTPLLDLTGGQQRVHVPGKTVRHVVNNLETVFPALKHRLAQGNHLAPGIVVVVDGEASSLGLHQPVAEDSEVHFLPAIGGGAL